MTGYGRGVKDEDGREITVEVKTVNHRFLDLSFKTPKGCVFLEDTLRREMGKALRRGHADVSVTYLNTRADAKNVQADIALAGRYQAALGEIAGALQCPNPLTALEIAGLPGVLMQQESEEDRDALNLLAAEVAKAALEAVALMRETEGETLKKDLLTHLAALEALAKEIETLAPEVPRAYREKLNARLREAEIAQVDPQRLAQEVALFADKCAIDEELSRLFSHIRQMRDAMEEQGETGRRLDFLTQEMNREVNTIGSKALCLPITQAVVAAKSEIEKLREQVQNVE